MQHTHIILTHTFIDLNKLKAGILNEWENTQNLEECLKNLNSLDFKGTEIQSSKKYMDSPKSDKASGNVSMEQIRTFINQISLKFNEQTLLFFEDLNIYDEAVQQKLLKLLEEPPQNLNIILFARNLSEVLPTIKSRANIIDLKQSTVFKLLDMAEIENVKKKVGDVSDFVNIWLKESDVIQSTKIILAFVEKIDFKKVERRDMDVWFWMVLSYLENVLKSQNSLESVKAIAKKIDKVGDALKYNSSNVQKKFVFYTLL